MAAEWNGDRMATGMGWKYGKAPVWMGCQWELGRNKDGTAMGVAPICPLMSHTSSQPLHPALLPLQSPAQAGSIFAFDLQASPPPR